MKRIIVIAIIILLSLLVACSADAPATPEHETHFTAATAPLPYLLPDRTLLAVEILDLQRRWPEIRAVRPLAQFQDRLLEGAALSPDHLPLLTGERTVLALVSSSSGHAVVPIALLLPASVESAEAVLRSLDSDWSVVRARGALWIGPSHAAAALENVAMGDGTSLATVIPMGDVDSRLPPGGLARGWINPAALQRLLQTRIDGRLSVIVDVVRGLLSAELEAVRWVGFRRELESTMIVTDVVVAYNLRELPSEVSGIFDPGASSPQLPTGLPGDVIIAAAFRPEAAASLEWLRYTAQRNATSSLRHLEFWIDEFEERSGHDLKADLFDGIGEHGWFLGWNTESDMPGSWVVVLQAPDAIRVEATLLDLLSWSREHAWARTFGLVVPRVVEHEMDGTTVHAIALRTPFGQLPGLVFTTVDGHLVAGTDENMLQTVVTLVRKGAFTVQGNNRDASIPAHASFWARGPAIAGLTEAVLNLPGSNSSYTALVGAVTGLIAGFVSAGVRAWYEEDALWIHGEIMLDGSE